MAFAGGHGGPSGALHGPLSLACGRVMGMMRGAVSDRAGAIQINM